MAYLSRIWLNPLRTGAQRMLQNPQVLHAAVLGGLSQQPVQERVLWRLEAEGTHRLEVLVLTRSMPSWGHLVEQAGWPSAAEPQAAVRPYQPLLDKIETGREFAFRLKANPVSSTRNPLAPSERHAKRLATEERPRGVRVAHRTAAQQLAWLVERVDKWGFALLDGELGQPLVRLRGRERLQFRKGGNGERHRVVLSTATFEGLVRISDPDTARASLLNGVGAARAYGCGLITLAPPAGGR